MLHSVESFFKVPPCTTPATSVGNPHKLNANNISGFLSYHFIASGCFVKFRTTAAIKIGFDDIDDSYMNGSVVKHKLRPVR